MQKRPSCTLPPDECEVLAQVSRGPKADNRPCRFACRVKDQREGVGAVPGRWSTGVSMPIRQVNSP